MEYNTVLEIFYFVEQVNVGSREGKGMRFSAGKTVEVCLGKGILEDILRESRMGVLGMLRECNEKKVWKYLRQDTWEEGLRLDFRMNEI